VGDPGNIERVRRELATLARRPDRRMVGWDDGLPSEWTPDRVFNPETGQYISRAYAWHLTAELFESDQPVKLVTLDCPPGIPAYVMEVQLDPRNPPRQPPLYIKVHFGRGGWVVGRSFHYSYSARTRGESRGT
jgi:hypothetical protein